MKTKLAAEFLGTAFLLLAVVGSGIMGEDLSQGNKAMALLANSLATGAALFVLIQCLGPISGAHFNPLVSLAEFFWKKIDGRSLRGYILVQVLGAIVGVCSAHLIFGQNIVQMGTQDRGAPNLWISEVIATFGLISTIALAGRKSVEAAPFAIASYIVAAYWFTSSTSFANPAVTVARSLTNSFSGIAPSGVLPFIAAQTVGAFLAYKIVGKIRS